MQEKTRIIIRREGMYRIPTPDFKLHRAEFYCPRGSLRKDLIAAAMNHGVFYDTESGQMTTEETHINVGIAYNFYGVIYEFNGTIDEFLRRFALLDVSGNVKRCPACKECFVSQPSEFYKHHLNHIEVSKEKFRRESFSYYFGPN